MYASNQILIITGDSGKQLMSAIKFAVDYAGTTIESIIGVSEINGSLYFGNPSYEYVSEWQTILSGSLLPPVNENTLVEIVYNWLYGENCKKIYQKIWDEEKCGYWDMPIKGWKLTAFDDVEDGYSPNFGLFKIEPFYTEYLD